MSENAEITGVISPEDAAKAEKFKEDANEYFKSAFTRFHVKSTLAGSFPTVPRGSGRNRNYHWINRIRSRVSLKLTQHPRRKSLNYAARPLRWN